MPNRENIEDMRPNAEEKSSEVYECFECGQRYEGVESRSCDQCGGSLNNIGRSRDL